jgi:hypothetical protein
MENEAVAGKDITGEEPPPRQSDGPAEAQPACSTSEKFRAALQIAVKAFWLHFGLLTTSESAFEASLGPLFGLFH